MLLSLWRLAMLVLSVMVVVVMVLLVGPWIVGIAAPVRTVGRSEFTVCTAPHGGPRRAITASNTNTSLCGKKGKVQNLSLIHI